MDNEILRLEALRLALSYINHEEIEEILKRAEEYYKFLSGSSYEPNTTI